MRNFASFDLEIAQLIPDNNTDWQKLGPLGITCAAVALDGKPDPVIWQGVPRMSRPDCLEMLTTLQEYHSQGYTLLTWNGCKFDFRVLAEETGEWEACARLAADHVDMMVMVTFRQGHYLSLDAALKGAGLAGKAKQVRLSNGQILDKMDGSLAPRLWAEGETQAVVKYLVEDVRQPLLLAHEIEKQGAVRWLSKRGLWKEAPFERLYSVRECFNFPLPDTSWMTSSPRREEFVQWMPGGRLPA